MSCTRARVTLGPSREVWVQLPLLHSPCHAGRGRDRFGCEAKFMWKCSLQPRARLASRRDRRGFCAAGG